MTTLNDIVVTHNPVITQSDLEELETALTRITPSVVIQEQTPGMQANIEWFYPAAVAVFIASGYINGFLQEIGADGYHSLKNGLKNILRISKEKPVRWFSSHSLSKPDKENEKTSPSLRLTLEIENHENGYRKIEFIFPNNVDLKEAEKAIDTFHETIVAAIIKETPNEMVFGKESPIRGTSYAFEPESSKWKELTTDYIIKRIENLNKKRKKKDKEGKSKKKK